jgi:uncharacterized protein YecE (DUF72 family)
MAAAIRIGTCSWADESLTKYFYPPEIKGAEERLRYYADRFDVVEANSTYYRLPDEHMVRHWAERTPEGFVMNVKAFRLFTGHQTEPHVLHKDIQLAMGGSLPRRFFYRDLPPELIDELWKRFRECLLPLQAAGRLGLVHFQFPPWVVAGAPGRAQIEHCVQRMSGFDVGVELRHGTWFDGAAQQRETIGFLRELGVAHTVVDGPQGFANSVPALWEVTHPRYALVRLHGRNRGTWNVKGQTAASDRFNYDYPDDELRAMVPRIGELALSAMQTHVIFNNNMEDQGQRNARSLTDLLVAAGVR